MDEIYLSGTRFVSARRASQITGYAADYLGQLCRAGRLHGKLVGRNWYIDETAALEHRKRYKRASEEDVALGTYELKKGGFLRYEADRRSLIPEVSKIFDVAGEEQESAH